MTSAPQELGSTETARLVQRHRDLLLPIIERGGGHGKSTGGDGLLAAFESPGAALEAAVEMQRALAAYNAKRPGEEEVLIRGGIASGEVVLDKGGKPFLGDALNRAARVMSLADGGQVFTTKEDIGAAGRGLDHAVAVHVRAGEDIGVDADGAGARAVGDHDVTVEPHGRPGRIGVLARAGAVPGLLLAGDGVQLGHGALAAVCDPDVRQRDPRDERVQLAFRLLTLQTLDSPVKFLAVASKVFARPPAPLGRPSMIVRGRDRGTVSSTLLSLGKKPRDAIYQFANGSPDQAKYEDFSPMLRDILSRGLREARAKAAKA